MQDPPTPDAILAAVADWLRGDAASALSGSLGFEAKVAAGAIDLVRRQIAAPESAAPEVARLTEILGTDGDLETLTHTLCRRIETGEIDLSTPGLADFLIATTLVRIEVDQPAFPAAARLRGLGSQN